MEDEQQDRRVQGDQNPEISSTASSRRTKVSFPGGKRKKKFNKKLLFIPAVVVVLLVVAGLLIFKEDEFVLSPEPSPTPFEEVIQTPSPTPEQTEVDREEISIKVLNGTGIKGEAAFLQKEMGELGYDDVDIGNASQQDRTTTEVTFRPSVPDAAVDEVTDKLKELYKDVETDTDAAADRDIQIITGLRPGQSLPTEAPEPKITSTPTPTGTITVTPTASPTPTNSPTPTP